MDVVQIKEMGAAVANKVAPEAHAMESSAGAGPEPDGKSRGLLEDLGHKVEQSFEAIAHGRPQSLDPAGASASVTAQARPHTTAGAQGGRPLPD